ncbi:MAG TPA: vitamin K epoxide reductase family protein [Thermoanaerobaculia bacterium]|nr:vitamin K epoxide reductase family protein [Thermoanaerobaculia bacterium]
MIAALGFAALDSAYLTWRYMALRLALVTPGTSICSWSSLVDCDRVLLTPQANAFFVPNALLGLAFYLGCLVWWHWGKRLGPKYRRHLVRTLVFWLAVATVMTFRFFWLLFHLSYFCPLCPLNHIATYVALAAAVVLLVRTSPSVERFCLRPILILVLACVALFILLQLLWLVANINGVLQLPTIS